MNFQAAVYLDFVDLKTLFHLYFMKQVAMLATWHWNAATAMILLKSDHFLHHNA